MTLRRILSEPLLHFLLLGGLLFWLYGALNPGGLDAPQDIVVNRARMEALSAQFRTTWQRTPTDEELHGLLEAWVREEVYYREGLAQQLDRDDTVVRRRIVQKLTSISEAQTSSETSTAELQAWLDAHQNDYRLPSNYSLRQVYFNPARHGKNLAAAIETVRSELVSGATETFGDATMLPETMEEASVSEIAKVFGDNFAAMLANLPTGEWQGPVDSEFGVHLVMINASQPGRLPALNEVQTAVARDLLRARVDQSAEVFYQSLRQRYSVRMETDAGIAGAPAEIR